MSRRDISRTKAARHASAVRDGQRFYPDATYKQLITPTCAVCNSYMGKAKDVWKSIPGILALKYRVWTCQCGQEASKPAREKRLID